MPGAHVVGLVDPDADAARKVAHEFGIERVFGDIEEALLHDSVEVIDVCAPTPAHFSTVEQALKFRKSAIVEKPLVTERDEVVRIAELFGEDQAEQRRLISVVQNFRYTRAVRRAVERLRGGYLGSLVSLTCFAASRFPVSWTRSTWLYEHGGVLLDFVPHAVDLLVLFAGAPPARVMAVGGDFTGGDMGFTNYAQLSIEFENGVVAQLDSSWLTGTNMLTLGLHGTGGHVNLDVRNEYYVEYHGTYTPFDDARDFMNRVGSTLRRLRTGEFFRGPMAVYSDLLQDFFDARSNGTKPVVTLGEALSTSLILAAAMESLRSRKPVDCESWVGKPAMKVIKEQFGS